MKTTELELVCMACLRPMVEAPAPPKCTSMEHRHIRCEVCSPPGWAGCVRIIVADLSPGTPVS